MDVDGNEIYKFNPLQYTYRVADPYPLAASEELIGVYGVKDTHNWFSSFGFIVKVNN